METLAIYGGTFDPVHKAHIATALKIQDEFHFDAFHFVPCKTPLVKAPSSASAKQRADMLSLAIEAYPKFHIDLREIRRDTPSFMSETLKSYRKEYPDSAITLILGKDAFLSLPRWHEWEKLPELANILVMERPQENTAPPLPQSLQNLLEQHQSNHFLDVLQSPFGKIVQFNAGNYDLSSTVIRKKIQENLSVAEDLDPAVLTYIQKFGLYR